MMKTPIAFVLSCLLLIAAPGHAQVATVRVDARPVSGALSAEATVEAVRQATLAAQVPGRVLDVRVDAGDAVREGQLLLRIDAAEAAQAFAAAEAGVVQAQANRSRAQADFERARSLFERKFISAAALDQARTTYDAAAAQLRAAEAGREQAGTVQGYTRITAPLSGLVAARHVEPGEMAQPGRELVTVYDPASLRAVADVSQQRIAALGAGPLKARVELPDSGRWFDAARVTVLPAADARTHTVRVRIELPGGVAGVVPGSFARVHFATAERGRLVVPAGAILRRGELTAVYVADEAGNFSLRQLRLGETLADEDGVEVLAGLRSGETVALDPVQAGIVVRAARRP